MNKVRKVVIITGASQGIGEGLVREFLAHDYLVVGTARSVKASQLPDYVTVPGDISDPKTAQKVIDIALQRFGRIDTLVNNAGVFISKPFVEYTQADYDGAFGVNIGGFFHISQKAATQMLKQGSGHIVNITTSLTDQPISGVPAALASLTKGGLNSVTKGLAIEFAEKGIRVNAVSPGIIKTPMHGAETHEFLKGLHPMKRMGEVSEIAEAVLYLDNAAFVTGEILHVDGGSHAGRW